MSKPIPYLNEIVSLIVMLLMVVALVAGQAGATVHGAERVEGATAGEVSHDARQRPIRTTIKAHVGGTPLTISIDASAEFDYFRLEDE